MNVVLIWCNWLNQVLSNPRRQRLSRRQGRMGFHLIERFESREMLTASISGIVFDDVNGDKIKQANESPLAGAVVFVDTDNDGTLDPENIPDGAATEQFKITDGTGTYLFNNLPPGVTHLRVRITGVSADVTRDVTVVDLEAKTGVNLAVSRGTVSGIAFDDINQDGIKQPAESGHAGVTVYVDSNDNNTPDVGESQAVTTVGGAYTLLQVLPGSVHVRAVAPTGYVASPRNTSLTADQDLTGQDVALVPQTGTVSGVVFVDTDGDGQKDAGETGTNGVTVFLDLNNDGLFNNSDRAAITDANGAYAFSAVSAGTFKVQTVPPAGFNAAVLSVTLAPGASISTANVALQSQTGTVSGVVFVDSDNDGLKDSGETGKNGVTVFLDLNKDGQFNNNDRVTISDANGAYSFSAVSAGSFNIQAVPPAGFNAQVLSVTLAAGASISAANFALQSQTGTVSGVVFVDSDNDGLKDSGETGKSGVTVFLDLDSDGQFNNNDRATISDANGVYSFSALSAGSFKIQAVPPAGFNASVLNVTLAAGASINTADVAVQLQSGTVSGVEFVDSNSNGPKESGELGKNSVTVFLDFNNDGLFSNNDRATISDANGAYSFSAVPAGSFKIQVVPLAGFNAPVLSVTLAAGQTISTANFPLQDAPKATVEGTVYRDLDHNFLRTTSEPTVAGVVVFIDEDGDSRLDPNEKHAETNKDGAYKLLDVVPGTVTVTTLPVAGFTTIATTFELTPNSPSSQHDVGLQPKLQLSSTPVSYTTGTAAVQITNNAFVSPLIDGAAGQAVLNIKIVGGQKKDHVGLVPALGSKLTIDAVQSEILLEGQRIGILTIPAEGVSLTVTFDDGKFSADALHQILDSVRFNAPKKRAAGTATIRAQLQLGPETIEATRKLQIVSRRK